MNNEKTAETVETPEPADVEVSTAQEEPVTEKKDSNFFRSAWAKVGDAGGKFVADVRDKAQDYSEKKQIKDYEARLKKYNPLFPKEYWSEEFKLPNLIQIVDDAERRDIDVCEGAIGWRKKKDGVEVLYLYDEYIQFSGLKFVPAAVCDSIYYVDPHDRHRFIDVDSFFSVTSEEKMAELQHIAFSLGASRYWVEMVEVSKEKLSNSISAGVSHSKVKASASDTETRTANAKSQLVAEATFTGKRFPERPKLCWYIHDKNVQNLIEMRCSESPIGEISTYTIELNSSMAASMSRNTAMKIDKAVVSMGAKCDFNKKSEEEHSRKMYFKLEF